MVAGVESSKAETSNGKQEQSESAHVFQGREDSATSLDLDSYHQTKMYLTIGQSHRCARLPISSHNHHHPTGAGIRQPEGERDVTLPLLSAQRNALV